MEEITSEQLEELLEKYDMELCENCNRPYFKNLENKPETERTSLIFSFLRDFSDLKYGPLEPLDNLDIDSPCFNDS